MAANCRRLGSFLRLTRVCRFHHCVAAGSTYTVPYGPHICSASVPSCTTHHRWKTVDATVTASTNGVRGAFSRFWRWLDDDSGEQQVIGQEEKQEREALLQRVQEMYFAKSPSQPGIEFYKEVFQTLVKYNDRVGVETLWNFMQEMNVEADAELVAIVEPFLEKARRNVWFE